MTKKLLLPACLAALGVAYLVSALTAADTVATVPPAGGELKLPPGWTMGDMQKCMEAGTPGKPHARLVQDSGEWTAECQMWMAPDTEPEKTTAIVAIKPILGGRFAQMSMEGEMMGQKYTDIDIYGYDNVTKRYVSSYFTSMGTGIMQGTGEESGDGKSIAWTYTASCPITQKPMTMRATDTTVDANTKTIEMWGPDPKTGKDHKVMFLTLKRNN